MNPETPGKQNLDDRNVLAPEQQQYEWLESGGHMTLRDRMFSEKGGWADSNEEAWRDQYAARLQLRKNKKKQTTTTKKYILETAERLSSTAR